MSSNSYLSLLVLALAASTMSPVRSLRCAETQQIEDRGHTSNAPASGSQLQTRGRGLVYLGLGLTSALLTVALVTTLYSGDGGQRQSPTRPRPPTNSTQPASPSQPNNPPRALVGREERDLGRGLAVDTSKARSISNQDGRTPSSLDLLSRADLAKELILFSRMLDKLD